MDVADGDDDDSNDDDDNCPSWAEVSLQRIPGLLRPVNALWSLFLTITKQASKANLSLLYTTLHIYYTIHIVLYVQYALDFPYISV